MFKATNIYESLFPVLVCSKMFAFWCMRISKQRYYTSRIGYVFTSVLIIFYLYISFPRIFRHFNDTRENILQNIVINATLIIICISAVVILLHEMIFSSKIIGWIDNVNEFDKTMSTSMNCSLFNRSHRKVQYNSTVSFVIMTIFFVFNETVHLYFRNKNENRELFACALDFFIFSLPTITTHVFVLLLSTMMLILKERFAWINTELSRLRKQWHTKYPKLKKHGIESISKKFDYKYNEETAISVLEKLRLSYCRLEKFKEDLNSIYSFPLLITALRIFMYPLGYILKYLKSFTDSRSTDISAAFVTGPLASISHLIALSCVGSWTSKEAKKPALILLSIEHTSDEMTEYIKYFSNQVLFMEMDIEVFGLFTLNKSLLFSVMSELISYIILLIQFEES